MFKKSITVLLTLVLLLSLNVGLGLSEEAELRGKDFVNLGEVQIIKGELIADGEEWLLQSENSLYEVHLGNEEHQERIGLDLQKGEKVTIIGFVYKNDIAVISLSYTECTYSFRDMDGTPHWSGKGNNQDGSADKENCDEDEGENNIKDDDSFKSDSGF